MATQGKVISRYSKAIFLSLKDSKKADKVLPELEAFAKLIAEHKELALIVHAPTFSTQQRVDIIKDVTAKMKASQESVEILTAICKLGRLDQIGGIVSRLRVKVLENESIQPIQVWTAEPLGADEKKLVEDRFAKLLGKEVDAAYAARPSLVGGLKVSAGGRTFDGTVSGWLDTLKDRLVEGEA